MSIAEQRNVANLIPTMPFIKLYNGYGHAKYLTVFGHVLQQTLPERNKESGLFGNISHLIKLFRVKPVAGITVKILWADNIIETVTEDDGFFKAEWQSHEETQAGWHTVTAQLTGNDGNCINEATGKLFIPHITQYAFISDIDDTILVSHSATVVKRLRTLFTKTPETRKTFEGTTEFYRLLSKAFTDKDVSNPFFYISSSEWNLYDDIHNFLLHKNMPEGILLLNQLKLLHQLLKTGKTKHEGKILRIARVLEAFPNQRFILSGDNSQKDPNVYAAIAEKYASNIYAVYIRNISSYNKTITLQTLNAINAHSIHTCLYNDSMEAIEHAKKIGLIQSAG